MQVTETPPPSKWIVKMNSVSDLSSMREAKILTDITLVSADNDEFAAHKMILVAASPYFEALLMNSKFQSVNERVQLKGVSAETLKLYLDLLYGKSVLIENWRTAFDLYDYFKSTLLDWNKKKAVCAIHIRPADYLEYVERLDLLYDHGIPADIVAKTKQFVDSTVDLSSFDEEFVKLVS